MHAGSTRQLLRILLVDDDLDLLMLLERRLHREGHVVETAASLAEAEELLLYFEPDLVLLDINVQGEDGRQLCWKIKHGDQPQVRVIMVSGFDFDTGRSLLFGADALLTKPVNPDFLLYRIEQLFDRQPRES